MLFPRLTDTYDPGSRKAAGPGFGPVPWPLPEATNKSPSRTARAVGYHSVGMNPSGCWDRRGAGAAHFEHRHRVERSVGNKQTRAIRTLGQGVGIGAGMLLAGQKSGKPGRKLPSGRVDHRHRVGVRKGYVKLSFVRAQQQCAGVRSRRGGRSRERAEVSTARFSLAADQARPPARRSTNYSRRSCRPALPRPRRDKKQEQNLRCSSRSAGEWRRSQHRSARHRPRGYRPRESFPTRPGRSRPDRRDREWPSPRVRAGSRLVLRLRGPSGCNGIFRNDCEVTLPSEKA